MIKNQLDHTYDDVSILFWENCLPDKSQMDCILVSFIDKIQTDLYTHVCVYIYIYI